MREGDQQPRVTLASTVVHSVFAARALADQGWLSAYLSPLVAAPGERPYLERARRFRQRRVLSAAAGLPKHALATADLAVQLLRTVPLSTPALITAPDRLADGASRRRLGQPDIFHFDSGQFTATAELAAERRALVVCDRRSRYPEVEGNVDPRADRLAREFAISDFVIVNSTVSRDDFLVHGWPAHRVITIPLGVDLHRFAVPRRPSPSGPKRVLFVGRLIPLKGLDVLAQAVSRLPFPVELRVVGHGSRAAAATVRSSAPHVAYLGTLGGSDLAAEYAAADVLVLPSRKVDSFGLVVLEAMASGTPVVVSDLVGLASVVQQANAGLVVPPEDPVALTGALTTVLSDPAVVPWGENGRAEAAHWSWDAYGDRLVTAYREQLIPAWERKRGDDS